MTYFPSIAFFRQSHFLHLSHYAMPRCFSLHYSFSRIVFLAPVSLFPVTMFSAVLFLSHGSVALITRHHPFPPTTFFPFIALRPAVRYHLAWVALQSAALFFSTILFQFYQGLVFIFIALIPRPVVSEQCLKCQSIQTRSNKKFEFRVIAGSNPNMNNGLNTSQ